MDALAAAVARAEAEAQEAAMAGITLNLPTGRHAVLRIPEDITLQEAAALSFHIGGFIHRLLQQAESRRDIAAAPPGIVVRQ